MSVQVVPPSVLSSSTIPSKKLLPENSKRNLYSKENVKGALPTCSTGDTRDWSVWALESIPCQRCSKGVIWICRQLSLYGTGSADPVTVQELLFASKLSFELEFGTSST